MISELVKTQHAALQADSSTTITGAGDGLGIYLGTAIRPPSYNFWNRKYKKYLDIAAEQYDSFTVENDCKMPALAKSWDTWDWTTCDESYEWIQSKGGKMRFHALVWANTASYQNPSFVLESSDDAKKEQFLEDYITAVMAKYDGNDIYAWDVLNEIISDSNGAVRDHTYAGIDNVVCKIF